MSSTWWDDFKLGAAGLVDLFNWGETSVAALVYESQRAEQGQPLTPAQREAVQSTAQESVEQAAVKTAADVGDKVKKTAQWVPWVVGAVVVGVALVYAGPWLAAAAPKGA